MLYTFDDNNYVTYILDKVTLYVFYFESSLIRLRQIPIQLLAKCPIDLIDIRSTRTRDFNISLYCLSTSSNFVLLLLLLHLINKFDITTCCQ